MHYSIYYIMNKTIILLLFRALDKLRICVKYPIKISKNPIKMDDLRIKTLFKYTITQFFELGLSIGKFPLPSE
jgi:hypothetical protein